MTNLKSCPFCGSNNVTTFKQISGWYVYCHNRVCLANVYFNRMHDPQEDTISRWNNRKGEPKRMCGNCKHWKEIVDGDGKCDCRLNEWGDGQLRVRFNNTGSFDDSLQGVECNKWEAIE